GAEWPRDVLDALLADVVERVRKLLADVIVHGAADADAARFRKRLQPCGDVDAVAVDVVAVYDHVAEIDPDAKADAAVLRDIGVAVDHCSLHLDCAAHRIYDARKLDE